MAFKWNSKIELYKVLYPCGKNDLVVVAVSNELSELKQTIKEEDEVKLKTSTFPRCIGIFNLFII